MVDAESGGVIIVVVKVEMKGDTLILQSNISQSLIKIPIFSLVDSITLIVPTFSWYLLLGW
jgi:hypothetical protein